MTRRITYDSLRTVLQYLDPNIRFQLSIHAPSIRAADRGVPMKIDELSFSSNSLKINQTTYKLGIIQITSQPGVPYVLPPDNYGGVDCDVNEYGERDATIGNDVVYPGDIFFESDEDERRPALTLDLRISWLERDVARFINRHSDSEEFDIDKKIRENESMMKSLIRLQTLYNQKANYKPLYVMELTIDSPFGRRVERVNYTGRMFMAKKCLLNLMFERRKHSVYVKSLIVKDLSPLRLPIGSKFRIQELYIKKTFSTVYPFLREVIDETSYPLGKLELNEVKLFEEDFQFEVVRNCRHLIIESCYGYAFTKKFPNFLVIRSKTIHMNISTLAYQEKYVELAEKLKNANLEIGTEYIFRMDASSMFDIIIDMENILDAIEISDYETIIPLNSYSRLRVHGYTGLNVMTMTVIPVKIVN